MAEGVTRRKPGLAGYFADSIRELAKEVRKLLRDADRDDDPVSITILSRGPASDGAEHLSDGAVVILKGGPTVALFCQWAERNRILTRGKPIVSAAERERLKAVRLLTAAAARCPGCQVRIAEACGEAPVAIYVNDKGKVVDEGGTWVCSNCIDSGRWPKESADG